ncbi:hypothetical protein QUF55_07735, partial [Clostridiaceae bacterium HSG29]|nr:hypothetical protein [Clostridiaceae bacterium HSG29]
MKAKCNDTVRLEELSSHEFENYILQQPSTEYRPLFRNSHQRKFYEEEKHYKSNVEGNILYTDSLLGGGTIGKSEIIKINKQRWQIEDCFRIMKTEFKARP